MRLVLASALVLCAAAAAAQPVGLAPHRAVYELSLSRAGGSRGLESARGLVAFDFTGDACEGYALKYRQVTVLEGGETGARTSDLRSTTFESPDGNSFRFHSEQQLPNGGSTLVEGEAERRGPDTTIRLRRPERATVTLAAQPHFPTAHMRRLIEAARTGEATVPAQVFDGTDDGRKVYETLAVVGRRVDPGAAEPGEGAQALATLPHWPVRLSYFAPGQGERTPIYVISFRLYENGVSAGLTLDYGEFALDGRLTRLELLPESACRR
jgi:hypothetical protein